MRSPKTAEPLLISSVLIAMLGFITPLSILWTSEVAAFWVLILIGAFIRFGREGLWLLVGAPFVLFWPIMLVSIVKACEANISACP